MASLAAIVGVEIFLAVRREYLPTEPALVIGGTFGPFDGKPLRFVVLGDSTAAGLGAGSADYAYATVLSERLGQDGWRVQMTGVGVSGARTADVLNEQVAEAAELRPDLVFVGIGANDVTHMTSLDEVRSDMKEIIRGLTDTGARVVVAGAPDMRAAAWREPLRSIAGWRGRQVAAAVEDAAEEEGVPAVPLAKLTAPFFASDPEDAYGEDEFHPGPGGYRRWADAIYPYLAKALADMPVAP